MSIDRRTALRTLALAAGTAVVPRPLRARPSKEGAADGVGALYDATRCIGCTHCVAACAKVNRCDGSAIAGADAQLSPTALSVMRRYDLGERESFRKVQCMHCVDPGCVSACLLGAMHKDADGAVVWNKDLCLGCRYCEIACPFVVPRFQWDTPTPVLKKCELCKDRRAQGLEPACTSACRVGGLTYGKRADLLREAHRRIDEHPDLYNSKIYGEHDAGGTAVMYLAKAGVSFADMGLPELGTDSVPSGPEKVQHAVYRGFALPVALYGGLAVLAKRSTRLQKLAHSQHDEPPAPVGGRLLTWPVVTMILLGVIALGVIAWRFVSGLGAMTDLNDGYPFGLWIAFDVVTGTALACGGYAVALLAYALNKGKYHPLVRGAIVTSALGYTLGGLSVLVDIGRPWNFYQLAMPWRWNLSSILLEVAICIMCYTCVLWIEVAPAFLERWRQSDVRILRSVAWKLLPVLERAMPFLIALGMLLPTMHQSSLGGLMMMSGRKLSPLWQTPLLPALFLMTCIAMGYGAVTLESILSARAFKRPKETRMLQGLATPMAALLATYLVLRVFDLWRRGVLPLAFRFDNDSRLLFLELGVFTLALLALVVTRWRARDASLALTAVLVIGAGGLYRFSTFLFAFDPGPHWSYFPTIPEFAMTIGFVALEIAGYIMIVKRFPILRGAPATSHPTSAEEPPTDQLARRRAGRMPAGIAGLLVAFALLQAPSPLHAQAAARQVKQAPAAPATKQAPAVTGHFDRRCLTDSPDMCLPQPLSKTEPHKAVCATCHNLWVQPVTAKAVSSCTKAGCHANARTLTAFHQTVTPKVLADCVRCHPAHNTRIPGGAANCAFCHPEGGRRPAAHRDVRAATAPH